MEFLFIKNMSKKYKEQIVLDKVNLVLPSRGLVSLVGESGSGKSTFINCLTGIEKMDSGEIYFQNKKIKNFDKFRNKYVGMIYQNINLISFLKLKENIDVLKRKDVSRAIKELKVNKYIDTNINVISKGEAQRVAVLRALASSKRILICDEPTGSLDKDNAKLVMDYLKEVSKNILVILVSHNIKLVNKYSDYILSLEQGKITSPYVKEEKTVVLKEKVKHISISKILKMVFSTLKRSKTKMVISFLGLSISLSFLLFSYSASSNIGELIIENKTNYFDYNSLRIVKEKVNEIENSSLKLVKEEILTREDVNELAYLIPFTSYHYDLTPIFTSYPLINHPISSEYYYSNIEFVPYFKKYEDRFVSKIDGRFPKDENEVVINSSARKYFTSSRFNITIDKFIDLKLSNNEIVTDKFYINKNFTIVGQVEEFELLETPKIYFPYEYLVKLSKEIKLEGLTKYYKTTITLYDRLTTIRGRDETFASSYLYLDIDSEKVEDVYTSINSLTKENERYKAISLSLEKIKSFKDMFDSIITVLNIFVGITLLISGCLLLLVLFSYILDFKKDIGIMLGIGVLKEDISLIFLLQSIVITFISLLISLVIFNLLTDFINRFLISLIGIEVLNSSLSFTGVLILLICILCYSVFSSLLISKRIASLNISEILREE